MYIALSGQDGMITLTVTGTASLYLSALTLPDGSPQTATITGNTGSFTDLPAGDYTVGLLEFPSLCTL